MKPIRIQQFARAIISVVLLLALASCGQQTPTVVNSPGSGQLTAQAAVSGLTGTYYDLSNFTGPTLTRVDTTIDFAWGTGAPLAGIQPTTYAVLWTGQILAPTTEEYTFFVTSGGGARLMVNGQVVTNNWTDHAVTTNSGKVRLVTGQKVDVRLEYYRNTANPGTIKLEWSSATRVRAIVPATALYSEGSNTKAAITALKADTNVSKLNLTLNEVNAVGILTTTLDTYLVVPKQDGRGFVQASVFSGAVKSAVLFDLDVNKNGTLTDIVSGLKFSMGSISAYFNADGTQTAAQNDDLRRKIAVFLSNGSVYQVSTPVQPQSAGGIKPQGIVIGTFCSLLNPPPPCAGDNNRRCFESAEAYRVSICGSAGLVEDLITLLVPGVNIVNLGYNIGTILIPYGKDILDGNFTYGKLWDQYLACIKAYPTDCKVLMGVTPLSINLVKPVGSSGKESVVISNNSASDATLEIDTYFEVGAGMTIFDILPNNLGKRRLLPSGTQSFDYPFALPSGGSPSVATVDIIYRCPTTPKVIQGTLKIINNSSNKASPFSVSVTIKCLNGNSTLVGPTPNPLKLKVPVGQTASGVMTFTNTGTTDLIVDIPRYHTGGAITIPPGGTGSFTVSFPCLTSSGPGVYDTWYAQVQHNDPSKSAFYTPVTITCTGVVRANVNFAQTQLTSDTGYQRQSLTNSSGQFTGYRHYRVGTVLAYGTPSGSPWGISGGFSSANYNCSFATTGINYDSAVVRANIDSCTLIAVTKALTDSLPAVKAAIEAKFGVGGWSLINLRVDGTTYVIVGDIVVQ